MSEFRRKDMTLPTAQEAIRAKCFHPTGPFVEFEEIEINQSIPERFERIVRRYPDRPAVRTKNGSLNYDQLNKAANRLARAILARRGEGQEPVALLVKDGVGLLTAHLAVLKAGKFSLGIDPLAPDARTAHILDDSQAPLIIADSSTGLAASKWAKGEKQLINADDLDPALSEENIQTSVSPDAYSHIRYTSGSTGQAKGGLKTHRHVLHAVMNATNYFHICAEDRSVVLTRDSCFGKYAFEILLNGAALCPFYVKEEGLVGLADWLIQEQMTFYYSFPTAFRHFLNSLSDKKGFPKLRLIRLEGEPVYASDVALYRTHFSSECLLVNSFSSTETGPVCLYYLDKDTRLSGTSVPAGYPVEGMDFSLLDEFGREVEFNQPGEIAVKSPFLSSGYWRRPDLTQTKFLPQSGPDDERVYLTGDLGRRSEDGCLELIGRKDFQVKIRSFRVDIGEVEAVLTVHPQVKEVTIIAMNNQTDDTKLVAYFVANTQPPPTTTSLGNFLKERLPDYMIPANFVALDNLPLLSTGKVDRRALPEPGNKRPSLDTSFVAPRTPIEDELSKLWANILSLDHVGIHDNFFDLGGHSLAATRLISKVVEQFKLKIPLQSLFQSPTVAEMATVIIEHQGKQLNESELQAILAEVEALTDEEALRLLDERITKEPIN